MTTESNTDELHQPSSDTSASGPTQETGDAHLLTAVVMPLTLMLEEPVPDASITTVCSSLPATTSTSPGLDCPPLHNATWVAEPQPSSSAVSSTDHVDQQDGVEDEDDIPDSVPFASVSQVVVTEPAPATAVCSDTGDDKASAIDLTGCDDGEESNGALRCLSVFQKAVHDLDTTRQNIISSSTQTLVQGEWVNDQIIYYVMRFICVWQTFIDQNTTHMFCLDSQAVAAYLGAEKSKAKCLWGEKGRPFHPTAKSAKDMQCRYFVIPFHVPGHWMLYVFDRWSSILYVADSSRSNTPPTTSLLDFVAELSNDAGKKVQVLPLQTIKQDDNYSCGLFVVEFALIVCQSSWTPESTALLQVTVADTIGKVNEMLAQPPSVVFEAASPKEEETTQDTFPFFFHKRRNLTVTTSLSESDASVEQRRSLAAADHEMAVVNVTEVSPAAAIASAHSQENNILTDAAEQVASINTPRPCDEDDMTDSTVGPLTPGAPSSCPPLFSCFTPVSQSLQDTTNGITVIVPASMVGPPLHANNASQPVVESQAQMEDDAAVLADTGPTIFRQTLPALVIASDEQDISILVAPPSARAVEPVVTDVNDGTRRPGREKRRLGNGVLPPTKRRSSRISSLQNVGGSRSAAAPIMSSNDQGVTSERSMTRSQAAVATPHVGVDGEEGFVNCIIKYTTKSGAVDKCLVQWTDGEESWCDYTSLCQEDQLGRRRMTILMAMANPPRASKAIQSQNQVKRDNYVRALPAGGPKVRKLNSGDTHGRITEPLVCEGVCVRCKLRVVAFGCSTTGCTAVLCYTCWDETHDDETCFSRETCFSCEVHGGPTIRPTVQIATIGPCCPQNRPTLLFRSHQREVRDQVMRRASSGLVDVTTMPDEANVALLHCHSHENATVAEQESSLRALLAGTGSGSGADNNVLRCVFVLTCFVNPNAYIAALKNISYSMPRVIFVAFHIPALRVDDMLLDACLSTARNIVQYDEASRFAFVAEMSGHLLTTIYRPMVYYQGANPRRVVDRSTVPFLRCGCGVTVADRGRAFKTDRCVHILQCKKGRKECEAVYGV